MIDLDGAIAAFVEGRDIPIFGIANAQGFADALPGWHPKELRRLHFRCLVRVPCTDGCPLPADVQEVLSAKHLLLVSYLLSKNV